MSPQPPTTPVRAAHRIDQAALEGYLARHVPDAVPIRAVSQFAAAVPAVTPCSTSASMRPSPLGPDDSDGGERASTLAAGVGASSVVPRNRVGRHQNSRVNPRMAPWFSYSCRGMFDRLRS